MKKFSFVALTLFIMSCSSGGNSGGNYFTFSIDGASITYRGDYFSEPTQVLAGVYRSTVEDPDIGTLAAGTSIVAFSDVYAVGDTQYLDLGMLVFSLPPGPLPVSFTDLQHFAEFFYLEETDDGMVISSASWFTESIQVNIRQHGERISGSFTATLCDFDCNIDSFIDVSGEFNVQAQDFTSVAIAKRY